MITSINNNSTYGYGYGYGEYGYGEYGYGEYGYGEYGYGYGGSGYGYGGSGEKNISMIVPSFSPTLVNITNDYIDNFTNIILITKINTTQRSIWDDNDDDYLLKTEDTIMAATFVGLILIVSINLILFRVCLNKYYNRRPVTTVAVPVLISKGEGSAI